MSTKTYKQIEEEIEKAEKEEKERIKELETQKRNILKKEIFTGEELLQMRNLIKKSHGEYSTNNEPGLDYILEQIMKNR